MQNNKAVVESIVVSNIFNNRTIRKAIQGVV